MSRLFDAIDDLAPPPPPCFLNRTAWTEYLKSCASNQSSGPKIILIKNGDPHINFDYPMCAVCDESYSREMEKKGKCQPDFLKRQENTQK